jgi:prevent-host-death family protein
VGRDDGQYLHASPANAGAQLSAARASEEWVPAFAGTAPHARSDPGALAARPVWNSQENIIDDIYGRKTVMKQVSLAEAKAHLIELVAHAAAGEPVCIMRRGKPVAQLIAVDARRKRIKVSASRRITDTMPGQSVAV